MKKLLQKILSMAIVVTILFPSISSAEENALVSGVTTAGWTIAFIGGVSWAIQGEAPACISTLRSSTDPSGNNLIFVPGPPNCAARDDHEKLRGNFAAVAAAGLAVAVIGEGIQYFNKGEKFIPFQVRPIQNGIALERDGFSFSAVATGNVKLQKRWEF